MTALTGVLVVLLGWTAPLTGDSLFWWVPKALLVAEHGPGLVLAGELPTAALPGALLPPQWADGLPDYGHPPLWYGWLGLHLALFGGGLGAVHAAAIVPAAVLGWGLHGLLRRAAGPHVARAAPLIFLLPPLVAQLQSADTDLPLIALTPWALIAVLDRRDLLFAVVAALATACKEPGVLLVVPLGVAMLLDRRWTWAWLAPLATLAAWAALHHSETGWALAGSERLPESLGGWLRDLAAAGWILVGEQGRWGLLVAAAWGAWKRPPRRRPVTVLVGLGLGWWLFFGTLNFLGGLERADAHTHVRYFVPGMLALVVAALATAPRAAAWLAVCGLFFLHAPSRWGPEASLWGIDTARAVRDCAERLPPGTAVGTYAYVQLTRPWAAGLRVQGLSLYAYGTAPDEVGTHLLAASVGEPLGRLQELDLVAERTCERHNGGAVLYRVERR